MDIDDIAEFTILDLFGKKTIEGFIKSQETYVSFNFLHKLNMIYYLIKTKGTCWKSDIINALNDKPIKEINVEMALYFLTKNKYLTRHEHDKILGNRYELTNKSMFLLRQYALWMREEEKKYHYRIKESHRKSRELKENN